MMDLRRLSHVLALADALHFARAAERVHLSQPAFSRSIQAIEADLGIRLFDRDVGDVRPTPAGAFVIERARRLLFDARCLQRDVDLFRDSQLGDTAFGAGPFPAATLMPRALSELRSLYPKVALRVEEGNWKQLLERLRTEDLEFFVADVRDLPEDPGLEIRPLGTQSGFFYVRTSHPLAGRRCTVADAWQYGVAATKLPNVLKTELARVLSMPAGEQAVLALECDDIAILRAVALSTDTVLAATHTSVQADLDAGTLLPLRIEGLPSLFSEMGVVSLRNRTPSPMAQNAISCIARVAGEVNAWLA
ncbi:LysR family transcriptional regulator [Cupriavidus sp. D39]|uniref:LysR family transcriptional regulator n=1 Tax=Cupriavidus sp. D39 TaxID=2997877 RepID=UPI00226F7651|nr:LysR family transcriptional regulator [Cupriavidus sp. D39]MCY0854714.1 LysR family transcriptional regulator [Cupriavidus sp. D39]